MLRIDDVRIGDTGLLPQFLDLCSIYQEGAVFFTAPYYDETFIGNLGAHLPMASIEFEVIVKNANAAEQMRRSLLQQGSKNVGLCFQIYTREGLYI